MSKEYMTPDGVKIIGTKENLLGTAGITGINEDGSPNFDGGTGTEIHWDAAETARNEFGQVIYICEDGEEWTFDQLVPVPDGEE